MTESTDAIALTPETKTDDGTTSSEQHLARLAVLDEWLRKRSEIDARASVEYDKPGMPAHYARGKARTAKRFHDWAASLRWLIAHRS